MVPATHAEQFAAYLRMLKERSGRSFGHLGKQAGISGSSLHRYCSGASIPSDYRVVYAFARACGASREETRDLHRLWALADAGRDEAMAARQATAEMATAEMATADPATTEYATAEPTGAGPAGTEPATAPLTAQVAPPPAAAPVDREEDHEAATGGTDDAAAPDETATVAADAGDSPDGATGPDGRPRKDPAAGAGPADAPDAGDDETETADVGRDAVAAVPAAGRRWYGRRSLRYAVVPLVVLVALVLLGSLAWALDVNSIRTDDGAAHDDRLLFSDACRSTVSMGQHDECVREVQTLLARAGGKLAIDGDFGPETQRRVTAFQVLAGLPPKGVVDDRTKRALYDQKVRMATWPATQVEKRIREVFVEAPDHAVSIARCQSLLDPLWVLPNTNGTRNWGLFMISDFRLHELGGTPLTAYDPEWNIQAAHRLWAIHRDFRDWPYCEAALSGSQSPGSAAPSPNGTAAGSGGGEAPSSAPVPVREPPGIPRIGSSPSG